MVFSFLNFCFGRKKKATKQGPAFLSRVVAIAGQSLRNNMQRLPCNHNYNHHLKNNDDDDDDDYYIQGYGL
jgi:hypothetical protein